MRGTLRVPRILSKAAVERIDGPAAIISRSAATVPSSSSTGLAAGPSIRSTAALDRMRGTRSVPLWTAAATIAMHSGVASTVPWPKESSASSPVPSGGSIRPQLPPRPVASLPPPKPHFAAVSTRSSPDNRPTVSRTNVVLQEYANASANVTRPCSCSPAFLIGLKFGIVYVAGQSTSAAGSRPASSSAAAVTVLNVDPGGKKSRNAL
jgi:hypothetical protein